MESIYIAEDGRTDDIEAALMRLLDIGEFCGVGSVEVLPFLSDEGGAPYHTSAEDAAKRAGALAVMKGVAPEKVSVAQLLFIPSEPSGNADLSDRVEIVVRGAGNPVSDDLCGYGEAPVSNLDPARRCGRPETGSVAFKSGGVQPVVMGLQPFMEANTKAEFCEVESLRFDLGPPSGKDARIDTDRKQYLRAMGGDISELGDAVTVERDATVPPDMARYTLALRDAQVLSAPTVPICAPERTEQPPACDTPRLRLRIEDARDPDAVAHAVAKHLGQPMLCVPESVKVAALADFAQGNSREETERNLADAKAVKTTLQGLGIPPGRFDQLHSAPSHVWSLSKQDPPPHAVVVTLFMERDHQVR